MNITDPCFYCDTCYYMSHFDQDGAEKALDTGQGALQTFPYRGG